MNKIMNKEQLLDLDLDLRNIAEHKFPKNDNDCLFYLRGDKDKYIELLNNIDNINNG